jgi:hypothetical protein
MVIVGASGDNNGDSDGKAVAAEGLSATSKAQVLIYFRGGTYVGFCKK